MFREQSKTPLQNVKAELKAIYADFDGAALEKLKRAYQLDPSIHLEMPKIVRHIIRKNGMTHAQLQTLYRDLLYVDQRDLAKLCLLCQILKYAIKRGGNIDLLKLIDLCEIIQDETAKAEILMAIVYALKGYMRNQLETQVLIKLRALVNKSPASTAKEMLANQLDAEDDRAMMPMRDNQKIPMMASPPNVKLEVVKQQHTTRTTQQNKKTEQIEYTSPNAMQMLRNRQKTRITVTGERVPTLSDIAGNDQQWYNGTYYQVISLYQRIKSNCSLKLEDKDDYLPGKFLNSQEKWFAYGGPGSFFIDRMICKIFYKVSKKQRLNSATINKLFECFNSNLTDLKIKIFGTADKWQLARIINNKDIRNRAYEKASTPRTISKIAKKIFSECIYDLDMGWIESTAKCRPDRLTEIINEELEKMRFHALSAVYNLVLRDNTVLGKHGIRMIENCINRQGNSKKLKNVTIKILEILDRSTDVNYKMLFNVYLSQLEEDYEDPSIVEKAIDYIIRQSRNRDRCNELFNECTISKIIAIIGRNKLTETCQLACLDVISNYLQYSFTPGLTPEQLNSLTTFLRRSSGEFKEETLKIILLTFEKNKNLPINIIIALLTSVADYHDNAANLVIMIMAAVSKNTILNFNLLAFKLLDDSVIAQEGEDIQFVRRTTENQNCQTISYMTAKIIHDSLLSGSSRKVTRSTVQLLVKAMASPEKQTRILAVKSLYLGVNKQLLEDKIDYTVLLEIQVYLHELVPDIAIYATLFYVESLYQHALTPDPIPGSLIDYLNQLYVVEELRLENTDYTQHINKLILEILFREINKKQVFSKEVFNIFNYELSSQKGEFNECLDALHVYVVHHGHLLPPETIAVLESKLDLGESHDRILSILCGAIKNGQPVGEKTLTLLVEMLYKPDNKALRGNILEKTLTLLVRMVYKSDSNSLRRNVLDCLFAADSNQDLPDSIFNVLELARAGLSIQRASADHEAALRAIEKATAEGQKLPVDLFDILIALPKKDIDKMFAIFKNVVSNKQSLPLHIINRLGTQFDLSNPILIEIFYYFVKNNQELPNEILVELQSLLINYSFSHILAIFFIQLQQGKSLPNILMDKIFNWYFQIDVSTEEKDAHTTNNELSFTAMKQSCFSAIYSFMQKPGSEVYAEKAQRLFLKGLQEVNVHVFRVCVDGLKLLATKNLLSKKSIATLIHFITTCNNNDSINEVINLLQRANLSPEQQATVKLLSLSTDNDADYLEQCGNLAPDGKLFLVNFSRINLIIQRNVALHKIILILLLKCSNADEIPTELANNISTIMLSSRSAEIKSLAHKLMLVINKQELEEKTFDAPKSIFNVEQFLLKIESKEISFELLFSYKQAIPNLTDEQVLKITAAISDLLTRQVQLERKLNLLILESMVLTAHTISDTAECERILMSGLSSDSPRFRNIAFSGMCILKDRGIPSWKFHQFCQTLKTRIFEETQQQTDDRELLQTLVSIHYVDFPLDKPLSSWNSELILADWAARFKLNSNQKQELYKNWLLAKKRLEHSDNAIKLLHQCDSLPFYELLEILKYLPKFNFEKQLVLITTEESGYKSIRKIWLKSMLASKFSLELVHEDYIELLLSKMANLPIGLPEKLLTAVGKINNIIELQQLLDFFVQHKVSVFDISQAPTLQDIQQSLELKLLINNFKNKNKLDAIFNNLFKAGWKFNELSMLVKTRLLDEITIQREESLFHVLYLMSQYNASPHEYRYIYEILTHCHHSEWLAAVNQRILDNNFSRAGVIKSPAQLVMELQKSNTKSDGTLSTVVAELVDNGLLAAMESVNDPKGKAAHGSKSPIVDWNADDISKWANIVRKIPHYFDDPDHIIQGIAIVKRANFLITGFQFTPTQILACLIALLNKKNRGRLLQVATGEGKTTILSTLAIILELNGNSDIAPDIFTSSSVRAEEDARNQASLYQFFGITVADNIDRSVYVKGVKACYRRDVVYGEMSQFQFDTLRDEYSLLGTKSNRASAMALLDEVDSIIIDDASKIAKLASNVAGMDQLQPIYFFLWQRINALQNKFIEIDGKLYFFNGMLSREGARIVLRYQDQTIPDLKAFLATATAEDISKIGELVQGDMAAFIEKHLHNYFNELIENECLRFPANFSTFVASQKDRWIKNALLGLYTFQECIYYIVQHGLVKPVAFNSNGTIQNSTNWSDGLHQFLQMKHGLHLTSETYTTNYLSNIAMVRRYGSNFIGFTGTLGSPEARKVLEETYQVDLVNVPSARENQYKSLPTIVAENQESWLSEICFEANHEVLKGRGVLIICKTIEDVRLVEKKMKARYRSTLVKTYTLNGEHQEREVERIAPGEIIIATNLAGRGTDINADLIEKFGGLSVLLTYLPENVRVEQQALGRTSRQGKLGTGRKILNKKDLVGYDLSRLDELDYQRDQLEKQHLEQFKNKELALIETKDQLFKNFCELIKKIRIDIRKKSNGVWKDIVNVVTSLITDIPPSVYERTIIAAVEEEWAMFLRRVDDGKIDKRDIAKEYDAFAKMIYKRYESDTIIQNPCHHVALANDLLMNESFFENVSERAMQHYEAAIRIDPQFSAAAFVGKAWVILKTKRGTVDKTYKQLARAAFEQAARLVADEMNYLLYMQAMLKEEGVGPEQDIVKQLTRKMSLLGSYLKSIETAINSIKKSQRLIALTQHDVYQRSAVTHHELEKDAKGEISHPLQKNKTYSVEFNDLTVQHDSGTIDQAVRTITAAFSGESKLDKNYQHLSIKLPVVNLADIQSFLSPHLIFKNLNKENALKKLHEKSSYHSWIYSDAFEVEIVSNGKIKSRNMLSIREAKRVVDNLSVGEHVNLTFKNSNEISKSLTVEFLKLRSSELSAKLNQIAASTIDIELTGNKEDLLAFLNASGIGNVELIEYEELCSKSKVLCKDVAIEKIKNMGNEPITIKLRGLNKETAIRVSSKTENLTMNATFHHIDLRYSLSGLTEGQANVYFTELSAETAESYITRLREEQRDFSVRFDNLTPAGVTAIVKKADLRQEDMEISAIKPLSSLPIDPTSIELELAELSARGIEHILEVNEQQPIPWRSICAVSMLAGVQMAAGIMLVSTGFCAQIGLSVMTEGTADLLMVCRAYSNRSFNWTDYCKQKSISLVLSATGLGWQAFQRANRGMDIYRAVGQEMAEQSGVILVANGKEIARELNILAFAQVGVSVTEAGIREGLNQLADNVSHLCFEHFKPQIASSVRSNVKNCFVDSSLSKLIRKMNALDDLRHTKTFQVKIDHTIRESFDPKNSFWRKQWESVGVPLCGSILSDQQFLSTPLSMLGMSTRVIAILNRLNEFVFVIERVHDQLFDTLSKIDQEMLSIAHLLQQDCLLNKEDAIAITQLLREQHVLDQDENIDVNKLLSANFGRYEVHKKKVVSFLKKLHESMGHVDTTPVVAMITDAITGYVIRAAETELITPATRFASAKAANLGSRKVQDLILRNIIMNRRQDAEDKLNVLEQKPDITEEENNAMHELRQVKKTCTEQLTQPEITVADRITDVSQQLAKVYAQHGMALFGQKSKPKNTEFKGNETRAQLLANQYAESVADDASAELYEMSIMQARQGVNTKIVEDPNYKLTPEDREAGVNVIVFIKADNAGDVGHWELRNEFGKVDIDSEGNDCGYAIFAKLTGKSVAQLRNETAQVIAGDPENFQAAMQARDWIVTEHPMQANDFLFNGGKKNKKEKEKNKDDEMRVLDLRDSGLELVNDTYNASQAVYLKKSKSIGQLERLDYKRSKRFNAAIGTYRNRETGNIVIALQGTDFSSLASIIDTSPIAVGGSPICIDHARKIV